ncbi:hypothetical protein [Bradyrhizobium sp. 141]|uniref:hypothetical protein n=1 Tax=Bradyrhizobium sp. 141 TaxID=2782617 RepID=UPI001FFAF3A3|nr:hypothetical protein [Bradyrhizobium sp. 141]MCK1718868.1 hypothetical protein [Bradyrhizobium sp. 141]
MALTNNTLPSIVPEFTLPLDNLTQFCSAQTITATGYFNDENAVVTLGEGRFTGMLALDITALDVASGDETYKICLFGSNDNAFGNGNVDMLAFHDFAAASAGRQVATILAPSPTIPPTGRAGSIIAIPFTNVMQGFVYKYAKLYGVLGGTSPSITMTAWITPIEMKV